MRTRQPAGTFAIAVGILLLVAALGAVLLALVLRRGLSARDEPWAVEAFVARRLRVLAIPATARAAKNPVVATPEVLRDARAHFADHCAICHANDGNGETDVGRSLYPPAPDMRKYETQSLADGELFYIIRNGIRFTGMPAWGSGHPSEDRESWKLVHFIRRLPDLTPEEIAEMETLNPRSPHEHAEGAGPRGTPVGEAPDRGASRHGHRGEGPGPRPHGR